MRNFKGGLTPQPPSLLLRSGFKIIILLSWLWFLFWFRFWFHFSFNSKKFKEPKNILLTRAPLLLSASSVFPVAKTLRELQLAHLLSAYGYETYFCFLARLHFRIDGPRSSFQTQPEANLAMHAICSELTAPPPVDSISTTSVKQKTVTTLSQNNEILILQMQKIAELDFIQG